MENENAIEPIVGTVVKATKKLKGGKVGRPTLIKTDAFVAVANKSETPEALINGLQGLREYAEKNGLKKAKQYVAMRAWSLRAKGVEIKTFPSGKRAAAPKQVILTE